MLARMLLLLVTVLATTSVFAKPKPRSLNICGVSLVTTETAADISKMSDELLGFWQSDFDLTGREINLYLPTTAHSLVRRMTKAAGLSVTHISTDDTLRQTMVTVRGERAGYAAVSLNPEVTFMHPAFFYRRGAVNLSKLTQSVYDWYSTSARRAGVDLVVHVRTVHGTGTTKLTPVLNRILGRGAYSFKRDSVYSGLSIYAVVNRDQLIEIHALDYVDSISIER